MKTTFVCNESMVISIPIGKLKDAGPADLMPEKFTCVFKDSYKIFVINGKPKPLGAAQALAGVFLCCLGLIVGEAMLINTVPSVLFVVSGLLSYAAGRGPHMGVAKLSFSLNIISFFWSVAAFTLGVIVSQPSPHYLPHNPLFYGVNGVILSLLVVEGSLALFLIYWLSKAVCRQHFNTLPIILLKHGD
ncbi:uncharacterized protein LOC128449552 [Pleuronectes platessa]|uniref:uncharacterized protein LOC128449552 n=1 Tax=Pleuronectes platessa TaxID=8262 RepID=UPI00232A0907|nr:uncharacterized protein LOC128449552 [Pleuronectes platessa]XP_053288762.1 uncharacterized protein LOC128449552 [Pleuronectes platessa]